MSRKNKGRNAHSEEDSGEAWLLPYSDLMTLLLAVFIVLFAVSKIDAEKAKNISDTFRDSMMNAKYTVSEKINTNELSSEKNSEIERKDELELLEELKTEVDAKLEMMGMASAATTSIDARGLIISFNNAIFFESGSAEIKKENEQAMLEIARMINTLDNYIRIEGHTDNVPMSSIMYPSNWELSTARAVSVVRLFIDKCQVPPEKLVAVGYGEYKPIAENTTIEGRRRNRRIDIIVLSQKYEDLEKQMTNEYN